jgi:hypothetical protein
MLSLRIYKNPLVSEIIMAVVAVAVVVVVEEEQKKKNKRGVALNGQYSLVQT